MLSASVAKAQTKETLVVYFDFDKSSISLATRARIDSFLTVQLARDAAITKVELSGHCDFIGSDGYNDALSTQRVNTIKELVESYDFAKTGNVSVIANAFGEKMPANENRTDEARRQNRRVEIILTTQLASMINPAPVPTVSLKEQIDSTRPNGNNIVLQNLNFYGGMHQITPGSQPILKELLDAMKSHPDLVIEIQGHICCENRVGDGMDLETGIYNLSAARAKAIYDHLISNGIEASRVSYKGFGHSQPLYPFPEKSEEERAANRRVEIKIIRK